jgi:hypothetical protein
VEFTRTTSSSTHSTRTSHGEKTCRACYWKEWAKISRLAGGEGESRRLYSREEIVAHLDCNGYDLVATTVEVNDGDDPIIARCRSCNRIFAKRMGDIGFGCFCSRNVRSASPTSTTAPKTPAQNIRSENPAGASTARVMLADSEDPARDWWDHERNTEQTFLTVSLRATRTCHWVCPVCRLSISAKVVDMTAGRHSCPDCSAARNAAWQEEYERWKTTPVADVPELAVAWADEADPQTAMVAGSWEMRRFRCPAGHPGVQGGWQIED